MHQLDLLFINKNFGNYFLALFCIMSDLVKKPGITDRGGEG